jgi:hypothetical protein
MQSIVNTFNCALEDGVYILDLIEHKITDDVVELLNVFLDEIVDLGVECLIAIRVCLIC